MNAPPTITKKLGQLEVIVNHSDGTFTAFINMDGDATPVLEGRIPVAIAADAATQEAVHVFAKTVMDRMVAVLMPGVNLTVTRSRKEQH